VFYIQRGRQRPQVFSLICSEGRKSGGG